MNLRRWLHVASALAGLALAATIVYVVFGHASQQGATSGDAPGGVDATAGCGSIEPVRAGDPKTIEQARDDLPAILDEKQVEVVPSDPRQVGWFARLHAASGLCIDEVAVLAKALVVVTSYPDDTDAGDLDAFTYGTLVRAFQPPLARTTVRINVSSGDREASALVSASAWKTFQRHRAQMRLPASMQGLAAFRRKVGYSARELQVTGWSPTAATPG